MTILYEKIKNIVEKSYDYLRYIGSCHHVESQIQLLSITLYNVIILLTGGVVYDNQV